MPRLREFYQEPVPVQGEDTPCSLCEAHRQAAVAIPDDQSLLCVKCGQHLDLYHLLDRAQPLVLGESNTRGQDEHFRKAYCLDCPHCGEHMAVNLVHVTWNANHDVYYTGGPLYCPDKLEVFRRFEELAKPKIENFVSRLVGGEMLQSWHLLTWLKYEMDHLIAGILYDAGLQGRSPPHEGDQPFELLPSTTADKELLIQGPVELIVDYDDVNHAEVLAATQTVVAALNRSWEPTLNDCRRRRGREETAGQAEQS